MTVRVRSARFHQAPDDGADELCPVERHLTEHIGDEYALVDLERPEGRFTLVVDAEWLRFAHAVGEERPDLVDGLDLPSSVLLAVVVGWQSEWPTHDDGVVVPSQRNGVLHLSVGSRSNN